MSSIEKYFGNLLHSKKESDKKRLTETRNVNKSWSLKGLSLQINGLNEFVFHDGTTEIADEESLEHYIISPIKELNHFDGTKYVPEVKKVTIDLDEPIKNLNTTQSLVTSNNMQKKDVVEKKFEYETRDPQWDFNDIFLIEQTKEQIFSTLDMIKFEKKLMEDWGLEKIFKKGRGAILNFFGPPGTGKTITTEAIAKHLRRKILIISYPDLESKYVGETPKNIKRAFEQAKDTDAVLVFDEADSFLGKRLTNVSQAADYGVNVTRSTMFMEIEKYTGVLIFTTNLMQNYDQAFMRRILANIYFDYPDLYGRRMLWKLILPNELPIDKKLTPDFLAKQYEGITGADIKDIVITAATLALNNQKEIVTPEHIDKAAKLIQNRYNNQFVGEVN